MTKHELELVWVGLLEEFELLFDKQDLADVVERAVLKLPVVTIIVIIFTGPGVKLIITVIIKREVDFISIIIAIVYDVLFDVLVFLSFILLLIFLLLKLKTLFAHGENGIHDVL